MSHGKGAAERRAYEAAGVNVAAGDVAVELMRPHVESTRRPEVLGALGGFGGAIAIPAGYREPVLVASTDGVGTKTAIATAAGRYDTIGIDLVAMCVDDVVCTGAEPIAFLDYVAVGRLDPQEVAELVGSVAAGCRTAGCALIGGETAEHPGVMAAGSIDVAGCAIGVVEREALLERSTAEPGDVVVGLASSGLHANGFSLVRSLIADRDIPLDRSYQEQLRLSLGDAATDEAIRAEPGHALVPIGHVLLEATRIYAPAVLDARRRVRALGFDVRGITHITGGGLPGNVPRALPDGLAARLDPSRWPMPSIMRLLGALGGIEDDELRATFNGGIGMAVVVPSGAADALLQAAAHAGIPAWVVGEVVPSDAIGGARYVEGPLETVA